MPFYEIEFPLATLSSEVVEAALLEIGAQSITFVDRGDCSIGNRIRHATWIFSPRP
jgi:hypothetical protein